MVGFAETEFGQEASVEPKVRMRASPNYVWTKRGGVGKATLAEATSEWTSVCGERKSPPRFGQGKADHWLEATGGRFQPAICVAEVAARRDGCGKTMTPCEP